MSLTLTSIFNDARSGKPQLRTHICVGPYTKEIDDVTHCSTIYLEAQCVDAPELLIHISRDNAGLGSDLKGMKKLCPGCGRFATPLRRRLASAILEMGLQACFRQDWAHVKASLCIVQVIVPLSKGES